MKKRTLLILLLATMEIAVCKAKSANIRMMQNHQPQPDTLSIYAGKYQRLIHNDMFYIQFEVEGGNLIGSTLWDGNKLLLKHLSGDNFIVSGIDWGVRFLRDKDGKVTSVTIRGQDSWTKVKTE